MPSYGQLFIVDNNEATECRLHRNSNLDKEILHLIDNIMRTNNVFAQSYRMMHKEIEQITENNSIRELQLRFLTKKGIDRGRYNVQRVNEVAAVFSTTADGEIPETYVTIYNKNEKTLQQVSTMNPNVEPWIYPLFYPYGNQGWHDNLQRKNCNKRNQKQLRAETYQGLIDYLANTANNNNAHIGKMIILPSTFVGSPRNMLQHYQDAMAIVRKNGKPDIFVTMTCNPNWREIKENLLPNQQPADRPDICARNCKISNSEIVDKFISAEIPDPNENESLHNVVMKHMIHGPCGNWCLINDKCSKHFPKPFRPETTMDEDDYPHYRRRNNGLLYERPGRYVVDNRYVVSFNPTLLLLFNSHINVEIVSRATSFQELRTVNNETHQTFTAACLALELIEDDEEWYRAMNEAKIWMMPRRLRNLFVRILIHCQPVHPKKLWDKFKIDMSEDYARRFGPIIGIKKVYNYITNVLQMEGSNIANFPELEQEIIEQEINNEEQIEEDTSIDRGTKLD
ncbi:uncharacterized protein LOC114943183 [Nylanderia fulva]|uniref:uncharacterized protein LOC114943183 n=1 Tax=Nylanderia fulva TaxID=613905 RepID=UPI0010FB902E|nr:uncharacterized protein LOC114943183 [Nylanderia fulva]